jgi:hypothetical protein
LRTADNDVESPAVDVKRHGADAGDGINNKDRVGLLDDFAHGFDVVLSASGRFRGLDEDAFDVLVLRERVLDLGRLNSLAIRSREHSGFHAPGFHDFDPALAEFAGGTDEDFVSRRKEVLGGSFETTGAGSDQNQHVVRSAENGCQIVQNLLIQVSEIFRSVVDVRAHHGVQGCRKKRGRTGGEQTLFLDIHAVRRVPSVAKR